MLRRPWRPSYALCHSPFRQVRKYIKSQLDPVIEPSSRHHHDLQSFLEYAKQRGLKETGTVYQGTLYEYTVQSALLRLNFSLTRVGKRGDEGVDLLGTWKVPTFPQPIRVFFQCKSTQTPVGPQYIRELEGTFGSVPAGWRGIGVIGFLASRKRASKSVRVSLRKSMLPMAFINVRLDGTIREFVWNRAAVLQGLEGLNIAHRYMEGEGPGRVHRDIALYWNGIVMPYVKDDSGNIKGMLDKQQKDELIRTDRIIKEHIKGRIRVSKAIAKAEQRSADEKETLHIEREDIRQQAELNSATGFGQSVENFTSEEPLNPERSGSLRKETVWRSVRKSRFQNHAASESKIGGFPTEEPPESLLMKKRGRPSTVPIDKDGFPTRL